MQSVIQFVLDHYKDVILALVAIDAALIPLFPNAGILGKIKEFLSPIAPKA